jgi:raffinose synthase Sip1-like protein/putative addiction module component
MVNEDLQIVSNDNTGKIEIIYEKKLILSNFAPILYYDEDWLSEQNGQIEFSKISVETIDCFEDKVYFGKCLDFKKEYIVKASDHEFKAILHLFFFADLQLLYCQVELIGNKDKSDKIGGYIDMGAPQNLSGIRFFHGANWRNPIQRADAEKTSYGLNLFDANQDPWQEPVFVSNLPNNEELSISYLVGKIKEHSYVSFVPVNRYGQRSLIRSCSLLDLPKSLKFVSGNYLDAQKYNFLAGGLIQFGEDPLQLTGKIFEVYMNLVDRPHVLRKFKPYPTPFEYLGFCTWNTFYRAVDIQAIRDLAEENFTINAGSDRFKYLIIDDGWQSINGCDIQKLKSPELTKIKQGLRHFEANYKFPNGIEEVSSLVKNQYNFKWLGVWHAATGYWDGVEPNSPLGRKYDIKLNNRAGVANPVELRGFQFWVDYYKHLRSSGVDLLKIDNQASLGRVLEGILPLDEAIENHYIMQQGAAYAQNLEILNCMCMASDNKIHWTKSNVSRVSDDFYPGNIPLSKHQIKQCIFNPLYYANFCWPDHDMFQTNSIIWEPLKLIHMISGGPVYIADEVGETNTSVVNKLCFSDGKIPRLDMPALPTIDCIFQDSDIDTPSKMWNYHDLTGWGRIYYYYLVNMVKDDIPIESQISLIDLGVLAELSLNETEEYIVKDQDSDTFYQIYHLDSTVELSLENMEPKYFSVSPVINGIALLGSTSVYNGTKTISSVKWIDDSSLILHFEYKCEFCIFLKDASAICKIQADGKEIELIRSDLSPNLGKFSVLEDNTTISIHLNKLKEIEKLLPHLSMRERAQLAHRLIQTLDTEEPNLNEEKINHLWIEEAHRRSQEIKDGIVKTRPAEEVLRDARNSLK